jgi:putative PIN family toxin of toxin-antitoxin system
MRLALDTDVMVAALRSHTGASRQLLTAAFDHRLVLLASAALMLEYESVLKRPEHMDALGVSLAEIDVILDAVISVAEPVAPRFLWRPQLKDPGDEMVLEAAVNGGADRLATFNVRHLGGAARRFGILATPPSAIWRELKGGA